MNLLKLDQCERSRGISNPSHFCFKAERHLRMASLEYEANHALPMNGPKGRLSFIEDGGTILRDAGLIVRYQQHDRDMDKGFGKAEQRCHWRSSVYVKNVYF